MRNNVALVGAIAMNLGLAGVSAAQTDPNPAVNDPDRQSWELFMTVTANAASAGHNNALFETWASDGDTFQPSPVWPSGGAQMQIGSRALSLVLQQVHPRFAPRVVLGGKALVGEETRRNKPDFDFIVQNKLFKVSGLRTVFEALKPITFPVDSMEVKANWVGRSAQGIQRLHRNSGRSCSRVSCNFDWPDTIRARLISHHLEARPELDLGDF